MITAVVRFALRPEKPREEILAEIEGMIPFYRSQDGLLHKQISLDFDGHRGMSVYLWNSREEAESFFEMARPKLREQSGAEPEISLHETQIFVDNKREG